MKGCHRSPHRSYQSLANDATAAHVLHMRIANTLTLTIRNNANRIAAVFLLYRNDRSSCSAFALIKHQPAQRQRSQKKKYRAYLHTSTKTKTMMDLLRYS